MRTAIIIPARHASKRLPGKPLVKLAGVTMLERVVRLSRKAAEGLPDVAVMVATDDDRIRNHCTEIGVPCIMTPAEAPSGTDRVAEAVRLLAEKPDFVLNIQGDAPLTPPHIPHSLIRSFLENPCDAITPVVRLRWDELDVLRQHKQTTPFSGTTAVFNPNTGEALWFSKHILPAMREEAALRTTSEFSPVYRHIGLYGFSRPMLEHFVTLPESHYEILEGLEQLRLLEHGHTLRCVPVDYRGMPQMSGIDSPGDLQRAEALLATMTDTEAYG